MRRLFVLVASLVLSAGVALAQETGHTTGPVSVQGGLGFTAGPDAFLLGFEADVEIGNGLSLGPMLQLGLDEDFTLVSPAAYARYTFDLSQAEAPPELRRIQPYVQGGLGFTYINIDVPNIPFVDIDDDDIGFLFNLGFGADYPITDSLSLGSKMLFNILPADVFNENFYFSWEVVALRYRF
jgi:hypothetical protein